MNGVKGKALGVRREKKGAMKRLAMLAALVSAFGLAGSSFAQDKPFKKINWA
jgi:hypothetical protein